MRYLILYACVSLLAALVFGACVNNSITGPDCKASATSSAGGGGAGSATGEGGSGGPGSSSAESGCTGGSISSGG